MLQKLLAQCYASLLNYICTTHVAHQECVHLHFHGQQGILDAKTEITEYRALQKNLGMIQIIRMFLSNQSNFTDSVSNSELRIFSNINSIIYIQKVSIKLININVIRHHRSYMKLVISQISAMCRIYIFISIKNYDNHIYTHTHTYFLIKLLI